VKHELFPESGGGRRRGEIVGCGAQTAAHDHRCGPAERPDQGLPDIFFPVPTMAMPVTKNPFSVRAPAMKKALVSAISRKPVRSDHDEFNIQRLLSIEMNKPNFPSRE